MAKTIVSKATIKDDPSLTLIKAFRIANKRAGEAKAALIAYQEAHPAPETPEPADGEDDEDAPEREPDAEESRLYDLYTGYCNSMKALSEKAEALGFHIWVNDNGHTGHTYAKDYKPTPSADNNFAVAEHRINQMQAAVSQILGSVTQPAEGGEPSVN